MAGSDRIGNDCATPCATAGRAATRVPDPTAAAAGAVAGAGADAVPLAAAANPLTVTTSPPGPIVPPLVTCTFSTTPLAVDGTSIVALSVSSVANGASK